MRGVIVALAPDETYGQLVADDGQRYSYWSSEVRNGRARVGHSVDFQMWEGQPIDIVVLANTVPPGAAGSPRPDTPQQAAFGAAVPSPFAAALASLPPASYWITLFTSPAGRISRWQFWLHGVLPIVAAGLVVGWIPIIGQILSLALLWASICIAFKRFQDLGYPGWWSLLYLVPFVGAMIFIGLGYLIPSLLGVTLFLAKVLSVIGLLIAIAQVVLVYVRVGQQGPNQYGPDPLGGAWAAWPT
jgi:uncharacterized membrane protein YhaH (DUF805 family)